MRYWAICALYSLLTRLWLHKFRNQPSNQAFFFLHAQKVKTKIFLFFLKFIFFELRFSLTIHSTIKIMKIKCRSTSNNYWGIFRKETSDVRLRSATSWYNNQNITVIVSENTLRHLKCVFFVLGNSFTLIKWKFYNIEDRKNGSVFRFNKLNL